MKYDRSPSKSQIVMIVLMGVAFAALLAWLVPEIMGMIDPAVEDTFSEWVFDLPLPAVIAIAAVFVIAGILFVWSSGHFIEGYRRRRAEERKYPPKSSG